jgi:hypothetical protein
VDRLERRDCEYGATGVLTDDAVDDEDVLDELPTATASSSGWSRRDGGTGGGWGFRDEMPRDKRGRAGRAGWALGGCSELEGASCEVMVLSEMMQELLMSSRSVSGRSTSLWEVENSP